MRCQGIQEDSIGGALDQGGNRPVVRNEDGSKHLGAKDLEVSHLALSEDDFFVKRYVLQNGIDLLRKDSSRTEIIPVGLPGQIPSPPQELTGLTKGLFEREVLQAVQEIMMNKGPHGPIMGDDLAGKTDHRSEAHSVCSGGLHGIYSVHRLNSRTGVVGGAFGVSLDPRNRCG